MKQKPLINEADIGKKIKSLRNAKRITLERLALQTGFTKGYLSKVEASAKAPPISTLGIIARALGSNISTLLGEDSFTTSLCLVKKSDRPLITRAGSNVGYSYEAVAHEFKNKLMDPFVLTLPSKTKKKIIYQHEGQELLFVLEGTMLFHYGDQEVIVEEGDCVYFDSSIPHYGESTGSVAVKCFMVIVNAEGK
jgi:transcriptional regulator with XRE-family HTH domain